MPGSLTIADGDRRDAAGAACESKFPGALAATVSLDQEALPTGERFDGRGDRPKGIDDLDWNRRQAR
jgi:hypothetical protein